MARILVVTGGGHVHFGPGIKRLIEGSKTRGWGILGSLYGWEGAQDDNIVDLSLIDREELKKMEHIGASPIFSSRTNPKTERVWEIIKKYGVTHVVAFGGEDTLSVDPGVPMIGWPKTMDNNHGPQSSEDDLSPGTYADIGYATAISFAGRETAHGLSDAQTNATVHFIVPFGRSQDFVAVGAAAYGCADFMVPGEINVDFEDFYRRLQEARLQNAERYHCKPFAVVVIPEGVNKGDAAGLFGKCVSQSLLDFSKETSKIDEFGHLKLKPEIIYLMAEQAIERRSEDEKGERKINKVSGKVLTYSLRDGPGVSFDRRKGANLADKCLQLIEEGWKGEMATLRWDKEKRFFTEGYVPISDAIRERFVAGTGFFGYKDSWRPTGKFSNYAGRFMGKTPERDSLLFSGNYRKAQPIRA